MAWRPAYQVGQAGRFCALSYMISLGRVRRDDNPAACVLSHKASFGA